MHHAMSPTGLHKVVIQLRLQLFICPIKPLESPSRQREFNKGQLSLWQIWPVHVLHDWLFIVLPT